MAALTGSATRAQNIAGVESASGIAASSRDDDQRLEADQAGGAAAKGQAAEEEPTEIAARLLERPPFDRITLNAANDNAQLEVVLLELPDRKVPDPLPTGGSLQVRQLTQPTIDYELDWSTVAKIELFEQLLFEEAARLTAANNFVEAFEYYTFLKDHYPELPGLEEALQAHLWREASTLYAGAKRDEAWPALHALYLRNPQFPRLVNAVQAVSDDAIAAYLKAGDYAAARAAVDALEQSFQQLPLTNVARWRQRFLDDAEKQMERAREDFAAQRYSEARAAVKHALAISPTIAGGGELWNQIQSQAPEIRVGVTQIPLLENDAPPPPLWSAMRVAGLTSPRLVELVDFGSEGGVYACRWGDLRTSDDGLMTSVRLSPTSLSQGIASSALALQLAEMGAPASPHGEADYAGQVSHVSLAGGDEVRVAWRRPHVRPESLLQLPLRRVKRASRAPALWYEPMPGGSPREQIYNHPAPPGAPDAPQYIVEQVYGNEESALTALIDGDIDVLERVPPWQLARLQSIEGIVVEPYRLPTIHVLIPNYENPLMELREFRRALCYGIDLQRIVRDIILAGQQQPGFRPVSGPFAVGSTLNDPIGYAYNTELEPRPYEPRLAALLAGLARQTLAKREETAKKQADKQRPAEASPAAAQAQQVTSAEGAPTGEADPTTPTSETARPTTAETAGQAEGSPAQEGEDEEPPSTKMPPIILAHPAEALARVACQTMKVQLDQIGIPVTLVEFMGARPPGDMKYDLYYAELAAWEPVADARRVLGAAGIAGRSGALMTSALDELSRSENWTQAAARLKEIHRIAYYDLPLIPLWQTINHCAYRRELTGVGKTPASLYQNVAAWRKSLSAPQSPLARQ